MMSPLPYTFEPIAFVQSPFKERYGVPRQPGLVKNAIGRILFRKDPDLKTALKTLEQFSHLWVIFVFHNHGGNKWKPSIRPPRLGGRTKVGVLASRSPHRPNPIGISVVTIQKVILDNEEGPIIEIGGLDMIDGTPVLDVKPYIPYADAIADANPGWASVDIHRLAVSFSDKAHSFLSQRKKENVIEMDSLKELITEILELDPRPAYLKREEPASDARFWHKTYGIEISEHEVKYSFKEGGIFVHSIDPRIVIA